MSSKACVTSVPTLASSTSPPCTTSRRAPCSASSGATSAWGPSGSSSASVSTRRPNSSPQRVPPRWTELALDLGYYDHAHFIRDFRLVVGRSPAEYAAEAARAREDQNPAGSVRSSVCALRRAAEQAS